MGVPEFVRITPGVSARRSGDGVVLSASARTPWLSLDGTQALHYLSAEALARLAALTPADGAKPCATCGGDEQVPNDWQDANEPSWRDCPDCTAPRQEQGRG